MFVLWIVFFYAIIIPMADRGGWNIRRCGRETGAEKPMKKLTAWLVTLVVLVASIPVCFADVTTEKTKVELEELSAALEVPEGFYVFTPETDPSSGDWLLAGYDDSIEQLKKFEEDDSGNKKLVELVAEDKSFTIIISRKYSSDTREYYNLNDISDEEFQELVESNNFVDEENGITATAEAYEHSQIPFFRVDLEGKIDDSPIWETCYGTIFNGYSLSLDMYSSKELTEEQQDILREIVDSVHVNEFYEKPTQEQMMVQTVIMLAPIIIIILLIVVTIVIVRVRNKSKERKKSEIGDKLVAYRKEQAAKTQLPDYVQPKVLFDNTTFCSDMAIKRFCQFHFFHKNLFQNAVFIVLGVVSVVMAIFYDDSWIMRLILAALGAYMIVQPFMSLDKMTKAEIRIYKKGRTCDAHYTFREEDFRISGIQSPMLYPYFQILSAYEDKNYFYLYYTDERAYLVDKNGFTQGESAEFRKMLKEQLGKVCHWK